MDIVKAWQNSTGNHDKNSQKDRNTEENPQFDNVYKNLQLISYFRVRNEILPSKITNKIRMFSHHSYSVCTEIPSYCNKTRKANKRYAD